MTGSMESGHPGRRLGSLAEAPPPPVMRPVRRRDRQTAQMSLVVRSASAARHRQSRPPAPCCRGARERTRPAVGGKQGGHDIMAQPSRRRRARRPLSAAPFSCPEDSAAPCCVLAHGKVLRSPRARTQQLAGLPPHVRVGTGGAWIPILDCLRAVGVVVPSIPCVYFHCEAEQLTTFSKGCLQWEARAWHTCPPERNTADAPMLRASLLAVSTHTLPRPRPRTKGDRSWPASVRCHSSGAISGPATIPSCGHALVKLLVHDEGGRGTSTSTRRTSAPCCMQPVGPG